MKFHKKDCESNTSYLQTFHTTPTETHTSIPRKLDVDSGCCLEVAENRTRTSSNQVVNIPCMVGSYKEPLTSRQYLARFSSDFLPLLRL